MGSGFFTIALDQLKYWTIASRVMADFQTFARQFRNDFLDRGGFMQLGQFSPSAGAVRTSRRLPKGQQFLAKLGVEQIKVEVILMKLANLPFVVKIMHGLFISVANFDKIRWKLARFGIPFREISFEIAAVATDRLTQFCEFLEGFENVL